MVRKHIHSSLPVACAAALALILGACSEAAEDTAFSATVDTLSHIDAATRAQLKPIKTHQQDVALPDGLVAKIAFKSARASDGALYLASASLTVDDTKGWTFGVSPASPPTNVGPGPGKDAVMQTSILVTQTQNTGIQSKSRTTKVDVRADGTATAN